MELYLIIGGIFFIAMLSALNITLYVLLRKLKLECVSKEKNILEQSNQIEKLNKEVANLSKLYDETLESCKKRTEFYSNITHELRTPLSVILGAIQLMEKKRGGNTEEDAVILRNLRVIKHNSYRMLRLVNNLLDLTKMEAGYLDLKPINCDLNILLEEIVQSVMPYAAQKQLELNYSKPPAPIDTAVDIEKIERIILNLLSNSIKFTKPGGSIDVTSYILNGRAYISVKDSGVGIPEGMQEEVFGRYRQSGEYPVLENEGSGIGLSLVKSFVDLHQGGIRVVSERGRGSEFIIDLPITHASESAGNTDIDSYFFRVKEAANIEFSDLHTIAS